MSSLLFQRANVEGGRRKGGNLRITKIFGMKFQEITQMRLAAITVSAMGGLRGVLTSWEFFLEIFRLDIAVVMGIVLFVGSYHTNVLIYSTLWHLYGFSTQNKQPSTNRLGCQTCPKVTICIISNLASIYLS